MSQYDGGMGTATSFLTHYMRQSWEAAGLSWDSDNEAEIERIVETIVAEAVKQSLQGVKAYLDESRGLV